jgi:oxygen-independent coproporphyrinogen-3 oxidase
MARNGHGIVEEEALSPTEAADEALVMGLRLAEGIDGAALSDRFGVPIVDWARVDRLVASGHLERNGSRITTKSAGRLLLDSILGEIAVGEVRALAVA